MTTRIPDLTATRLHQVAVCVFFEADDAKACAVSAKSGILRAEGPVEGGSHWLTLVVEPSSEDEDGETHLHVNLFRASWFEDELPPPNGDINRLNDIVEQFKGCTGRLYVFGSFEVPLEEVPKEGLVRELSRVSTEVGGLKISLSGAELSIQGGQFRRVNWSVRKDQLRGELRSGTSPIEISSTYVDDAVRFLSDGINKIIFAQDTRADK
jgi:hypothetical protein